MSRVLDPSASDAPGTSENTASTPQSNSSRGPRRFVDGVDQITPIAGLFHGLSPFRRQGLVPGIEGDRRDAPRTAPASSSGTSSDQHGARELRRQAVGDLQRGIGEGGDQRLRRVRRPQALQLAHHELAPSPCSRPGQGLISKLQLRSRREPAPSPSPRGSAPGRRRRPAPTTIRHRARGSAPAWPAAAAPLPLVVRSSRSSCSRMTLIVGGQLDVDLDPGRALRAWPRARPSSVFSGAAFAAPRCPMMRGIGE